jgi:hypothetical protein
VLAFGAAPAKTADPGRVQPGSNLRSQGPAVRSAGSFLIGFLAASTPIMIYVAWVAWQLAQAI